MCIRDRIEADRRSAARCRKRYQPRQVAEIAMAPIAARAHRIELDREAPDTPCPALKSAHRIRTIPGGKGVQRSRLATRHGGDQPGQGFRADRVPFAENVVVTLIYAPNFGSSA